MRVLVSAGNASDDVDQGVRERKTETSGVAAGRTGGRATVCSIVNGPRNEELHPCDRPRGDLLGPDDARCDGVPTGRGRRGDVQPRLNEQLAEESLVLLRNDGTLPLTAGGTIALIGPNAANARHMLGDHAYVTHVESLVEVLRSGNNVFAMPIEHGVALDDQMSIDHVGTVHGSLVRALPGSNVHVAARVSLDAGAAARVDFEIPVGALGFTGRELAYVVEPGDVEFFVGASAIDVVLAGTVTIAGDVPMRTVRSTSTRTSVSPTD